MVTVILLTDGAPTTGEFTPPEERVREILPHHRTRCIRIHPLDLGGKQPWVGRLTRARGGRTLKRQRIVRG